MERIVTPELLDADAGSEREVRDSLDDLARINRFLGGESGIARMLLRVAQRSALSRISVLDVAGGDGRLMQAVARRLRAKKVAMEFTVLDRSAAHLGSGSYSVLGDALELPFADRSFDAVCCNLFLHHLEPAEIQRFAAEALRVARHAFVASDLRRSHSHLLAARLGGIIYKSRITRHDSVASVKRAYTVPEMQQILALAGAARVEAAPAFFFRMDVMAWR